MKIKNNFELRNICGEKVIMAQGLENIDFSKMINLNETAAYLWEQLIGKDFTLTQAVEVLQKEYDVDEATATTDVQTMLDQWIELGLLDA